MYITKIEIEIRQSASQKLTDGTAFVVLSTGDEWRIEPASTHCDDPVATCSAWRYSRLDGGGWCDAEPSGETSKAFRLAEALLQRAIFDAHEAITD